MRGTLAGLRRAHLATGVVIEALADRLAKLFTNYDTEELWQLRLSQAPVETVMELDRHALNATSSAEKYWRPEDLPGLVSTQPALMPLGLYGRSPNWGYCAVAAATRPATLAQFDVLLGWVTSPSLHLSPTPDSEGSTEELHWWLRTDSDVSVLEVQGHLSYLDYRHIGGFLPAVPTDRGLICSGVLPLWLWIALARAYQTVPWLAFYQPTLSQAIVVATHESQHRIGERIPFTPGPSQNR